MDGPSCGHMPHGQLSGTSRRVEAEKRRTQHGRGRLCLREPCSRVASVVWVPWSGPYNPTPALRIENLSPGALVRDEEDLSPPPALSFFNPSMKSLRHRPASELQKVCSRARQFHQPTWGSPELPSSTCFPQFLPAGACALHVHALPDTLHMRGACSALTASAELLSSTDCSLVPGCSVVVPEPTAVVLTTCSAPIPCWRGTGLSTGMAPFCVGSSVGTPILWNPVGSTHRDVPPCGSAPAL